MPPEDKIEVQLLGSDDGSEVDLDSGVDEIDSSVNAGITTYILDSKYYLNIIGGVYNLLGKFMILLKDINYYHDRIDNYKFVKDIEDINTIRTYNSEEEEYEYEVIYSNNTFNDLEDTDEATVQDLNNDRMFLLKHQKGEDHVFQWNLVDQYNDYDNNHDRDYLNNPTSPVSPRLTFSRPDVVSMPRPRFVEGGWTIEYNTYTQTVNNVMVDVPKINNEIDPETIEFQASIAIGGSHGDWMVPTVDQLNGLFEGTITQGFQVLEITGGDVKYENNTVVSNNTPIPLEDMLENGKVKVASGQWYKWNSSKSVEELDTYLWFIREDNTTYPKNKFKDFQIQKIRQNTIYKTVPSEEDEETTEINKISKIKTYKVKANDIGSSVISEFDDVTVTGIDYQENLILYRAPRKQMMLLKYDIKSYLINKENSHIDNIKVRNLIEYKGIRQKVRRKNRYRFKDAIKRQRVVSFCSIRYDLQAISDSRSLTIPNGDADTLLPDRFETLIRIDTNITELDENIVKNYTTIDNTHMLYDYYKKYYYDYFQTYDYDEVYENRYGHGNEFPLLFVPEYYYPYTNPISGLRTLGYQIIVDTDEQNFPPHYNQELQRWEGRIPFVLDEEKKTITVLTSGIFSGYVLELRDENGNPVVDENDDPVDPVITENGAVYIPEP